MKIRHRVKITLLNWKWWVTMFPLFFLLFPIIGLLAFIDTVCARISNVCNYIAETAAAFIKRIGKWTYDRIE